MKQQRQTISLYGLTMRPPRAGDEYELMELLISSLPAWRQRSNRMEYWKWQYERNPLGFFPSSIGLVQHGNRLVSHFALIPRRVKIGNSLILAGLVADVATHPDYRGKGIFMTLAKRVLNDVRSEGFKMAYGFGLASRILASKIPWAFHEQTIASKLSARSFGMPMRLMRFLNLRKIFKFFSSYNLVEQIAESGFRWFLRFLSHQKSFDAAADYSEISQVQRFDRRYDGFWKSVAENYDVITERNSGYLNWRYIDVPSNMKYTIFSVEEKDQIKGYIVLRSKNVKDLKIGYIVDVLAPPYRDDVVKLLISKSLEFFEARSIDLVQCQMLNTHPYYRILLDYGFLWPPSWLVRILEEARTLVPSAFSEAYLSGKKPSFNICINQLDAEIMKTLSFKPSHRWFLTYGDGDAV